MIDGPRFAVAVSTATLISRCATQYAALFPIDSGWGSEETRSS
jgi:hypothetical protein